MDVHANFGRLSEQFREDRRDEACAILGELVTQSKLLQNR